MADYAIINKGGTVINMIVADAVFIETYLADNPTYSCVDTTDESPRPGVGWSYSGGTFSPPPPPQPAQAMLVANPATIPADGTTKSTVTWNAAEGAAAPASVQFNVNGALTTEATANNAASIEVTSTTPGDTITIRCQGLTTTVSVT